MKNFTIKHLIFTVLITLLAGVFMGKVFFNSEGSEGMTHDHATSELLTSNEVWTCSMHPQVRQNEPGICPICEMELIPLDNQLSNQDPTILQMTEQAVKLAQIGTFVVGGQSKSDHSHEIRVEGSVELDERNTYSQTSHIGGRIERLYVNFTGDYVSKGQKIATLYSPELLTASKELITADKFNDQIRGVKEATIRKLKNWKVTDEQIAHILETREEIETIDIYADYSGYVLKKVLSQGGHVDQGGVLYSVGQTAQVWLMFNVFESDLASIKIGQRITVETPAVPGEKFLATVTYINPILNPASRTASVRAEMNNRAGRLKPGMLIKGTIQAASSNTGKEVVNVPKSAVLWTGKKSVVYVQLMDMEIPSFRYREVSLGSNMGDHYEVLEGLSAGEVVVVNGAFVIDASAQLNNQQSMMNKDVTLKKSGMARHPNFKSVTPNAFRLQLENVIDAYLEVKDAFVATDPMASKEKTARMLDALDMVDMTLVQDDAHVYWMGEEKTIRTHGQKLQEETDVEEQRKQFDFLSQGIINVVKAFGVAKESVFIQFCPMAFNNKGAEWVSTEYAIKNPYFGDKMMKCGSVLDSVTVAMNALEGVSTSGESSMEHGQ